MEVSALNPSEDCEPDAESSGAIQMYLETQL